ncbi:putative inactive receptor kinase [Prunus yedoensis var. nudiflora]|uniref:Putative inactive receptor kinase n=1 Tax=Prunus yedoensis var. nudiflora TaxID=2094558 RepID=A0A314Z3W1_PRUYE|nr:putative inactive receptor kinase [Prunus yedoensis var. nudiflora]
MAAQSSVVIFMMMKYYLLAILLLCMLRMRCSTAQVAGYSGKEKDALVALKNSFNYTYLNTNWTGAPCFKSEPSTWYGIQCTGFNDIGRVTGIVLENMPLNRSINIFAFTNLAELSALTLEEQLSVGEHDGFFPQSEADGYRSFGQHVLWANFTIAFEPWDIGVIAASG